MIGEYDNTLQSNHPNYLVVQIFKFKWKEDGKMIVDMYGREIRIGDTVKIQN